MGQVSWLQLAENTSKSGNRCPANIPDMECGVVCVFERDFVVDYGSLSRLCVTAVLARGGSGSVSSAASLSFMSAAQLWCASGTWAGVFHRFAEIRFLEINAARTDSGSKQAGFPRDHLSDRIRGGVNDCQDGLVYISLFIILLFILLCLVLLHSCDLKFLIESHDFARSLLRLPRKSNCSKAKRYRAHDGVMMMMMMMATSVQCKRTRSVVLFCFFIFKDVYL